MKRKNIIPTDKERIMREQDFIVSKTDLTGRIIYGNEIFIEFSGIKNRQIKYVSFVEVNTDKEQNPPHDQLPTDQSKKMPSGRNPRAKPLNFKC